MKICIHIHNGNIRENACCGHAFIKISQFEISLTNFPFNFCLLVLIDCVIRKDLRVGGARSNPIVFNVASPSPRPSIYV